MTGPLAGVRIVELSAIGPAPFAAMVLGDLGADVVRVHRRESVERGAEAGDTPIMDRNRRSIGVDLKHPDGVETVLRLVASADALLEGFRPGVVERLGLGPEPCLARNPALVYGRMTGWGQVGPLAQVAGHDIDYIALAGALAHIGRVGDKPTPPINLLGDFGGGGMFLALGVVCGVLEARTSGRGQVVDAAMIDGVSVLMTMVWGLRSIGAWDENAPGTNLIDTGAPFYDTYECADGRYVAIGSLEPAFYGALLTALGLDPATLPRPDDRSAWPQLRARFTELFRTRTRDEWCRAFDGHDACFAPVLTMTEAAAHPQVTARGTIVEHDGVLQPAPAPRFSRTPGAIDRAAPKHGEHTDEILAEAGFTDDEIAGLRGARAIA